MTSRITEEFRALSGQLPQAVQRQAREAFRKFQQDPRHPSLNFKRVNDDPTIFSGRVGRRYRALAFVEDDTAAWFWIGPHSEYDELLKRL